VNKTAEIDSPANYLVNLLYNPLSGNKDGQHPLLPSHKSLKRIFQLCGPQNPAILDAAAEKSSLPDLR
jgi:hypothetical protein